MVISENCCNFIVIKYKVSQTIIAMLTDDKVTELFCMADDFCKFFDEMMAKYTIKSHPTGLVHQEVPAGQMLHGQVLRFQVPPDM